MRHLLFLAVGCFALVGVSKGQESNQANPSLVEQMFNTADKMVNLVSGDSWAFIPALTYSPETSLGLGARAIKMFRHGADDLASTRPSTLPITVLYTLNRQLLFSTELNLWTAENVGYFNARIELADFPFWYYGVGSPKAEGELYASKYGQFHLTYERRLAKGLYVGPRYEFRYDDIYRTEEGGELSSGNVRGSDGQRISGLGAQVNYDTRDNIFQPRMGMLHQAQVIFFKSALGSSFDYTHVQVDLRKYFAVGKSNVLALQGWISLRTGDVPFLQLSQFGGSDRMRGYFEGKYRDRHAAVFQSEYRVHVHRNLGVVFFGSLGQVSPAIRSFSISKTRVAGGLGFRYKLNEEGLNLRLDIGFGDQVGYYFGLNEVF